jgi:HNH endonuclease
MERTLKESKKFTLGSCQCGCKERIPVRSYGYLQRFKHWHNSKGENHPMFKDGRTTRKRNSVELKPCDCGCGQLIEYYNCRGGIKQYKKGHNVSGFIKHGSEHPSWRGGRTIDKNGYVRIWKPDGPRFGMKAYGLEHIMIMEGHLGRKLKPDERVHHINEIKTDNRIENLMVLTDMVHKRYHTFKMWREGKYNNRPRDHKTLSR